MRAPRGTGRSIATLGVLLGLTSSIPPPTTAQQPVDSSESEWHQTYLFVVRQVVEGRARGHRMAREHFSLPPRAYRTVVFLGATPGVDGSALARRSAGPHVTRMIPCQTTCIPGRGEVSISFEEPIERDETIEVAITVTSGSSSSDLLVRNWYTYILERRDGNLAVASIESADVEEFIIPAGD